MQTDVRNPPDTIKGVRPVLALPADRADRHYAAVMAALGERVSRYSSNS